LPDPNTFIAGAASLASVRDQSEHEVLAARSHGGGGLGLASVAGERGPHDLVNLHLDVPQIASESNGVNSTCGVVLSNMNS
jgi:hypothetical protein